MQNLGIIIGRFSPLHLGHISLINYSLDNYDKTIVIIGSAEKIDDRNPYSLQERKKILNEEFGDNIIINYLEDSLNDDVWISNLQKVIRNYSIESDNIHFLGGDLENDYAIKVIKEYLNKFTTFNTFFIEKSRQEIPISATKIRNLLKENKLNEAKKWLSEKTTFLIIKKK